jgi:hypothetical protein
MNWMPQGHLEPEVIDRIPGTGQPELLPESSMANHQIQWKQ